MRKLERRLAAAGSGGRHRRDYTGTTQRDHLMQED
jgi:hypothetical protein